MRGPDITVVLPPGRYYIGDPGYVINKDHWKAFLESVDEQTRMTRFRGESCCVFQTQYGDGAYQDQGGNEYCVDSGLMAAVPEALMKDRTGMIIRVTGRSLECRVTNQGTLIFGDIRIETGNLQPTWEEEPEDEGFYDEEEEPPST